MFDVEQSKWIATRRTEGYLLVSTRSVDDMDRLEARMLDADRYWNERFHLTLSSFDQA